MAAILDTTLYHFAAIRDKQYEAIIDTYMPGEDAFVFVEGPRWVTRGWSAICEGWRGFIAAPMTLNEVVWEEVFQEQIIGQVGWLSGIASLQVTLSGKSVHVRLRGSFVMTLCDDGRWRICHEHFSIPHADPYGIGDWLPKETSS